MAKFSSPKASDDVISTLDEGEVAEEGTSRPYQTRHAAPVPPAPAFDMQAFASMLAQAMGAGNQITADAIKDALSQATVMAREQIPENKVAPQMSAYNPAGDRDFPRPGLKCPMYLGQYDDAEKVSPAFEIIDGLCTVDEQTALNRVTPGVYTVERNDGIKGRVIVEGRTDASGALRRLVLALPYGWLGKEAHVYLPSQIKLTQQILEQARA